MSAHTPAPWLYENGEVYAPNRVDVIARADREHGCKIRPVERDANMRLCAAAPDLLAALEHLMRYDFGASDGAKDARAAIAKARGQ